MPRKCDPYCIIELSFLFGPRFVSLPASARVTYLALWGRAVDTRRIQLPYWYDTAALQRDTGLDTRTVRKSVALLQQKCLIDVDDKNRITVYGVKDKHGSLTWNEEPLEEPAGDIKGKSQSTLLNKPNLNKPPIPPKGDMDLFETKFEEIWKTALHHPNDNKKAAFRYYKATLKRREDVTPEILLESVKARNVDLESKKTEPEYRQHLRTFFGRDEHWETALNASKTAIVSGSLSVTVKDKAKSIYSKTKTWLEINRLADKSTPDVLSRMLRQMDEHKERFAKIVHIIAEMDLTDEKLRYPRFLEMLDKGPEIYENTMSTKMWFKADIEDTCLPKKEEKR